MTIHFRAPTATTGGLFSPLKGLKVIDCATFVAAPMAATALADMGATVIKVESLEGDSWRRLRVPGTNMYTWGLTGRGKKSIALDLKKPEGREILHEITRGADVFITNFPLPLRELFDMTARRMMGLNDRLIYGSVTAYGEDGPDANRPGFDYTAFWAESGLMYSARDTSEYLPVRSSSAMGDQVTALALSNGIKDGLLSRIGTGQGAEVRVSLLGTGMWANGVTLQAHLDDPTLNLQPPGSRADIADVFRVTHRLKTGQDIIMTGNREGEQRNILSAIGLTELLGDSRFSSVDARLANAGALEAFMRVAFAGISREQWVETAAARKITYAEALDLRAAADNPQAVFAEAVIDFADGRGKTIATPYQIVGMEREAPGRAPDIGEHSREILATHGYAPARISDLFAKGIVGEPAMAG